MAQTPPPLPPVDPTRATAEPDLPGGRPAAQGATSSSSSSPLDRLRDRTLGVRGEAAYLIASFPLAVVAFVVAVTAVAGSSALVTAPLFIPVLGRGLRAIAQAARGVEARTLGTTPPEPVYASDYPSTGSAAGDLWRRVTDPQTWLEIVWGVVGFVVATFSFVVTVTLGASVVAGLTAALWQPVVHVATGGSSGLGSVFGMGDHVPGDGFLVELVFDIAVNLTAGLLALVTFAPVVRALATVQSGLARALLASRGTADRYAALQRAHTAGQEAERESLRRLERDLHDGPQQRLVRLQMDLARAERMMATDPERAREILTSAGATASETLGELRGLSRGIAPPLLVDRGLRAAVEELAGTHPARVTVRDGIGRRLPEQVETALYFAVSEALANAAKHAAANTVVVNLRQVGGGRGDADKAQAVEAQAVEAEVVDDGVGGASLAKGHGLAGLQRRLAGVQGSLTVDSPSGGPTTVVARVPLTGGR